MNLSIRFKNNELFNSNDYTLSAITIIIINDIAFNVIIYIWYLLYSFGIITFARSSSSLVSLMCIRLIRSPNSWIVRSSGLAVGSKYGCSIAASVGGG